MLDQSGVGRYLRRMKRHLKGRPRLWGLHNYQDANDYTTDGTREVLKAVKGKIWLTETGGIVKLGSHRPYNPRRAAKAIKHSSSSGAGSSGSSASTSTTGPAATGRRSASTPA